MEIKKYLTKTNFRKGNNKKNLYIAVHYTANNGDTALNNCHYFSTTYRGASANYFVDENSIYQCVEDSDIAWHVGAKQYYNGCRNENSIGVELCSRKDENGTYYFKEQTVKNAQELIKHLMKAYNIPIQNVVRHFDTTLKQCPKPLIYKTEWEKFKKGLTEMNEYEALDYLVEKGRITNKAYWLEALHVVKDLNWFLIKWANDVKMLNEGGEKNG